MTTFLRYNEVPARHTLDWSRFTAFWKAALASEKHIGGITNSIFISPEGAGAVTVQNFQAELARRYGNMPGTEWIKWPSSPKAAFAAKSASLGVSAPAGIPGSTGIPPGVLLQTVSTGNLGHASIFSPDWAAIPEDEIADSALAGESLINVVPQPVTFQIRALSFSGSTTQVALESRPMDLGESPYFASLLDSTTLTDASLDQASNVVRTLEWDVSRGAKEAFAVITNSTSASKLVIVATRFKGAYQRGVQFTSVADGGSQTSAYFLANHGSCQTILTGLGYDAYLISTQGSDYLTPLTLDQTMENLLALIQWLRDAHDDAGLDPPLFLLVSDPPRTIDLTYPLLREYYSGVCYHIANTEGNEDCMALNLYAACVAQGWTGDTAGDFTSDGTHPDLTGGRIAGKALAGLASMNLAVFKNDWVDIAKVRNDGNGSDEFVTN